MSTYGYGTPQQEILDAIELVEPDPLKAALYVAEVLHHLVEVAEFHRKRTEIDR